MIREWSCLGNLPHIFRHFHEDVQVCPSVCLASFDKHHQVRTKVMFEIVRVILWVSERVVRCGMDGPPVEAVVRCKEDCEVLLVRLRRVYAVTSAKGKSERRITYLVPKK